MRKSIIISICMTLMLPVLLVGCKSQSSDSFEETTVQFDKKGRVTQQIIDSFDKAYYNVDELKQELESAILECNQTSDEKIVLNDIHAEEGKVYINISYPSAADYEKLQGEILFYGTISEAYDAGYTMDLTLKGTDNGEKISKVQIMGMSDQPIVILSEPIRVNMVKNVEFVSANVGVINETDVRVDSESGGLAYIVYSK